MAESSEPTAVVPVSATVRYISSPSGGSDILKPDLVCYKGIQFRKLTGKNSQQQSELPSYHEEQGEDEEEEDEEYVEELPNGTVLTEMDIPSVFFKYIIGREGKTRLAIERDTGCSIRIPRRGEEGPVVIKADTRRQLRLAKKRINVIMWSNRGKERPTHFIGIPLNTPELQQHLERFRREVLSGCPQASGLSEVLFQIPAKLHLTLVMMRIFSEEEQEKAAREIRECLGELRAELGLLQFPIKLSGIDSMSDDPSAVNVLFAKIKETTANGKLQEFVDALATKLPLRAPDLFEAETRRDKVKLHATVMNSKFRERDQEQSQAARTPGRQQWKRKESFDARKIFSLFKDFEFGEHTVTQIHFSKRGEYGEDGFYKCIHKFDL